MICQRARIIETPPAYREMIGKELWVEATAPQHLEVYSVLGKTFVAYLQGCHTAYLIDGHFPFALESRGIEWLARGPEDFCELTEFIPMEKWLTENGVLNVHFA
jgi:hypothetical protein